jgi:hypothetical protein
MSARNDALFSTAAETRWLAQLREGIDWGISAFVGCFGTPLMFLPGRGVPAADMILGFAVFAVFFGLYMARSYRE